MIFPDKAAICDIYKAADVSQLLIIVLREWVYYLLTVDPPG